MEKTPIRAFDVMAFLSKSQGNRPITTFLESDVIFSQGDPADSVFYLREGKVKVSVISGGGKEAVVAIHGPDEFFGEACLSGHPLRLASVAAMAKSEIVKIEKPEMFRFLREDAAFSEMFIVHQLARTARVESDLVDQLFNSSERRLARALLLLANFGKDEKPEPVVAKVSQEMLAEMIGTTRSRVNHFMNKFRRLGFIDYNGHLVVRNSLLSVVLGDQSRDVDDGEDSEKVDL